MLTYMYCMVCVKSRQSCKSLDKALCNIPLFLRLPQSPITRLPRLPCSVEEVAAQKSEALAGVARLWGLHHFKSFAPARLLV